jgi:hypothetical protein
MQVLFGCNEVENGDNLCQLLGLHLIGYKGWISRLGIQKNLLSHLEFEIFKLSRKFLDEFLQNLDELSTLLEKN